MGIDGLLKFLEPITVREHISSFQGRTAAIDIMSWLYKGCYRCAFELNQNIECNTFLFYIFEMLDLLAYYKIRPLCVFDGKYVGKKEDTLEKRRSSKEENKQRGLDYLAIGNEEQARKYLSRCINIDQRIVATTMRALHTRGIDFMVAPYESDSQIAKLMNLGLADFAITEDSDLVVYGLKVVLKLTTDGDCDYIDVGKWTSEDVTSVFLKQYLKLNHVGRLECAILSGTDYNPSVHGIGIKRSVKHVFTLKNMNNVVSHLRVHKHYQDKVPAGYEKQILDSKMIFLMATTYNPFTNTLEYLNSEYLSDFTRDMSEENIQQVVGVRYDYSEDVRMGRINLKTLEKRQIYNIEIKTIFSSVNASNLQSKELANQQRRIDEANTRQKMEEERRAMAENGNADNITPVNNKKKKVQRPTIVLTQQQRRRQLERSKAQRAKRFTDFKNVLNNFIAEPDSESQEEESSSQVLKEALGVPKKEEPKTTKRNSGSDEQFDTLSDSEQNICLQFLNPWLKI